jgi:hypothetical protein
MTLHNNFYHDVPFDEYAKWEALNASKAKLLNISPAHLRCAANNDKKSDALIVGTAVHTAVYEPLRFQAEYVEEPKLDRRTKVGKEMALTFEAANSDKEILSYDDYKTCLSVASEVNTHPAASKFIHGSEVEVSFTWQDKETGVWCKGRVDSYSANHDGVVTDLKTTRYATKDFFEGEIFRRGYYLSAAWYITGLRALGLPVNHFIFIAAEKVPPYGVQCYRITDEVLALGQKKMRELLRLYAECLEKDYWPCYPADVLNIGLPAWGFNMLENE